MYNPYGFMNPPWAPSCTFFSSGSLDQGAAEGDIVPFPDPAANGDQYGTVTEVRIKTPNYTQPGLAKLTVGATGASGQTQTVKRTVTLRLRKP